MLWPSGIPSAAILFRILHPTLVATSVLVASDFAS